MKFVRFSTGGRSIYYLNEFGLEMDLPRFVAECFNVAEPIAYLFIYYVTLPLTINENELAALKGFLLCGLCELDLTKLPSY